MILNNVAGGGRDVDARGFFFVYGFSLFASWRASAEKNDARSKIYKLFGVVLQKQTLFTMFDSIFARCCVDRAKFCGRLWEKIRHKSLIVYDFFAMRKEF